MDRFKALTIEQKSRIDFLTGHFGFGIHNHLPRPAEYVTLLRDPVMRVISRYHHEMRDPRSDLHPLIQKGMTLPEYVRYYAEAAEMDNLQTRMIAGNWQDRGHGPCTDEMLATAKENLQRHFVLVGVTDQFDAFYLLLRKRFDWPPVYYRRRNVSRSRLQKKKQFPLDTLRVIEAYNRQDMALYQHARVLLHESVQAAGPLFRMQLLTYQVGRLAHQNYWQMRKYSVREALRQRIRHEHTLQG
jgi:hypothetical protein